MGSLGANTAGRGISRRARAVNQPRAGVVRTSEIAVPALSELTVIYAPVTQAGGEPGRGLRGVKAAPRSTGRREILQPARLSQAFTPMLTAPGRGDGSSSCFVRFSVKALGSLKAFPLLDVSPAGPVALDPARDAGPAPMVGTSRPRVQRQLP